MSDRSGPKEGYDFSQKRHYRRIVWSEFSRQCPVAIATAHALLMPSLEGDEIDVALSKGFRQSNLHVVDKNPAIVATLKRRYRQIQTYGVTLDRAILRIEQLGVRLACASMDLCAQFNSKTDELLRHLSTSSSCYHGTTIALTTLRGREQTRIGRLIGAANSNNMSVEQFQDLADFPLSSQDAMRLGLQLIALASGRVQTRDQPPDRFFDLVRTFKYSSTAGSQTMLVAIWRQWSTQVQLAAATTIRNGRDNDSENVLKREYGHSEIRPSAAGSLLGAMGAM